MTSTPAGVSCGTTCTFGFDYGALVTLNASATTSTFTGWTGAALVLIAVSVALVIISIVNQ